MLTGVKLWPKTCKEEVLVGDVKSLDFHVAKFLKKTFSYECSYMKQKNRRNKTCLSLL